MNQNYEYNYEYNYETDYNYEGHKWQSGRNADQIATCQFLTSGNVVVMPTRLPLVQVACWWHCGGTMVVLWCFKSLYI